MEKAFILYDLEATCWRTSRPKRVEIIEVGAVKVNEPDEDDAFPNGETSEFPFEAGFELLFLAVDERPAFLLAVDVGHFDLKTVHGPAGEIRIGPDLEDALFQAAVAA